jgi:hypothetical protein
MLSAAALSGGCLLFNLIFGFNLSEVSCRRFVASYLGLAPVVVPDSLCKGQSVRTRD